MKITVGVVFVVGVTVAGCAKHPDDILAARVDMLPVKAMSCAELGAKAAMVDRALAEDTDTQKTLWALDILVPIPTGQVFNRETSIAALRGERLAIREVQADKRCSTA